MTAGIGDNSIPAAREQIRSYVAQIVASEREKEGVQTDIKELYSSAKDYGLNTTALRRAVKLYMESPTKRADREALEETVETYLIAAKSGGESDDD